MPNWNAHIHYKPIKLNFKELPEKVELNICIQNSKLQYFIYHLHLKNNLDL